jgi:hypothetical protein
MAMMMAHVVCSVSYCVQAIDASEHGLKDDRLSRRNYLLELD